MNAIKIIPVIQYAVGVAIMSWPGRNMNGVSVKWFGAVSLIAIGVWLTKNSTRASEQKKRHMTTVQDVSDLQISYKFKPVIVFFMLLVTVPLYEG